MWSKKDMNFKEKPCIFCKEPFIPTGGRQDTCPSCKIKPKGKAKDPLIPSGWKSKCAITIDASTISPPEDLPLKSLTWGKKEERIILPHCSKSVRHITCVDCKKVPDGQFCTDRCSPKIH
jgi:hypothetical protein